jgi:hypothetical protein
MYRRWYRAKYGSYGIRKPTVQQDMEADLAPRYGTDLIWPYTDLRSILIVLVVENHHRDFQSTPISS